VTPHARIGMLSEDRRHEGLALTLSIADNITMSDHGFWAWPAKALARTRSWIADLQIRARGPEQPVSELSGGNQQKVLFGRLLQSGAEVVFLDEPTRGVDVQSKMQIYRLIDDLAQQKKAVLVVSSYVPELLGVCDRIAVMFRGELGAAKPVNEWTEQSILAEATGAA